MGITISGENNNDKILASDGVIDQISGFSIVGVLTATSFHGDLIGDVTGNLTGNVTGNINNSTLLLQTGGTERVRVTSTGNIGLGVASPQGGGGDLSILGNKALRWSNSGGTQYGDIYADTSSNIVFRNGSSSTERLRITSAGDVGIGYNSPTVKLHVREAASGASSYDNRYHMICENNGEAYLGFYVPDNQYAGIRFNDTTGLEGTIDYYFSDDEMHFHSSAKHIFKTGGTERLRIASGGQIQIGNSGDPANYNGSADDIMLGSHTGSHGMTILSGTSNGGYIMFSDNNGGGSNAYRGQIEYQHNGDYMRFITATEERLRIDSSGRLLVGTQTQFGDGNDKLMIENGTTGGRLTFGSSAGFSEPIIGQMSAYWADNKKVAAISFFGGTDTTNKDDGTIRFATSTANNLTERLRIDAGGNGGRTMINHSDTSYNANLSVRHNASGPYPIGAIGQSTNQGLVGFFDNGGSVIGSITKGGSTVAYNTSSDYRLKENDVKITDGISRVKQLRPIKYNWKTDASTTQDGFFAHEVSPVVPESVTGEKDGIITQEYIDEGKEVQEHLGNPIIQSIDHSKLVPLLTAALQEAITKIETLESEVAALKSN